MCEVLVQFDELVVADDAHGYVAFVCGAVDDIHRWLGWLEFADVDGGTRLRTDTETVQPNRRDLEYWATGLTRVYLQGALARARHVARRRAHDASADVTNGAP